MGFLLLILSGPYRTCARLCEPTWLRLQVPQRRGRSGGPCSRPLGLGSGEALAGRGCPRRCSRGAVDASWLLHLGRPTGCSMAASPEAR